MTSAGLHAIVFSCERFESRRGPGAAADVQLDGSRAFDLPGPEVLSGRQILERIAALRERRIHALEVPFLSPTACSSERIAPAQPNDTAGELRRPFAFWGCVAGGAVSALVRVVVGDGGVAHEERDGRAGGR